MPPVPPEPLPPVDPTAPRGSAGTGRFTGEGYESVWKGPMPVVRAPESDEKDAAAAEPLCSADARYAWLTTAARGWSGVLDEATVWADAGLTVK